MALASSDPVSGETPAQEAPEPTKEMTMADIDLQALAEKVYRLFKEELRAERERLGRWN
jgi:hypothetical protein